MMFRLLRYFFELLTGRLGSLFRPVKPDPKPVKDDEEDEFICYYGCPNSQKAQKLQMQKKKVIF